jgi:superfamily II DNA or RNA helicase
MRDLETRNKVGVVLPTGAGKTEIFIEIAKRHWENRTGSILILSDRSILTTQTADRVALRAPEMRCGIFQDKSKPHVLDSIVVGTMQTAQNPDKAAELNKRLLRQPDLLIVDEAHSIDNESYRKIVQNNFPNCKVVGVTASPFRSNQIMTNYFEKISFSMSLRQLIDLGYLVPPKLFSLVFESKELDEIMAKVVSVYKERENGNNAIVFMKLQKDAKTLRNLFLNEGISCEAITGYVKGERRDEIINRFNQGDIRVLTTCDVLSKGFDSPVVKAIFQPYSCNSAVQYVQRVGRGLRKHDESGKSHCNVYVFGDAPSVSKNLYQRYENIALNQGDKPKEYETYSETLENNDWEGFEEQYVWTMEILEAVKKMKNAGMSSFSEMLNEKRFPKRFLENITDLLNKLPKSKLSLPNGNISMTEKQKSFLVNKGFTSDLLENVSKSEAHAMISCLMPQNKNMDIWRIKGKSKFAGKLIFEVPWAARNYCERNMPHSEVAKLSRKWNNRHKTNNFQGENHERMDSKASG